MSLRSADPRSGRIGGGGEGRAPGGRRVDVAGDWSAGEGELQNERRRKGEDSYRLNMEVIRTYYIVYGCPPERRQV